MSFTSPGSFTFNVPLGVTRIAVTAVGAAGGNCGEGGVVNGPGGEGATVSATVAVTPGEQLVVGVGGVGGDCAFLAAPPSTVAGSGGTGGGALGGSGNDEGPGGAGGGGESVVGPSAWPGVRQPLVVAGGGGGGSFGGTGGNAGSAGADGSATGSGGGPGDQSAGGSGGVAGSSNAAGGSSGSAGTGGMGGFSDTTGASSAGAGGGGGYYGGGGGGGSAVEQDGGAGGGGSSFVTPGATNVISPVASSSAAVVTIAYTVLPPPTATISSPSSGRTYARGQVAKTTFSCLEGAGGPGLSSCDASNGTTSVSGGSGRLDTSTPGTHTYTVIATSKDGLTGAASITYKITAPRVSIKTTRISVVNGKGRVKLSCSGATICRGKLTLTLHKRTVTVHYAITRGHTKTLKLALSKAALKLLAAAPNDRLSGVVKVKVTGGRAASRNVTVTLKA